MTAGPWRRATTVVGVSVAFAALVVYATWPVFSDPAHAVYDKTWRPDSDPTLARFLAGTLDEVPPYPARTPAAWPDRADTLLQLWTLAWESHALRDPRRFYDANILYPMPRSLTYSDSNQLGVLPWFAPVYWATSNPVLAYQTGLFLSAVACGVLFHALVVSWTRQPAAGLVTGTVAMLAPFHLGSLHLLYHYTIQYIPAALLCVEALLARRDAAIAAAGLAALLALQAACSVYLAYTTFLLVPLVAIIAVVEARRPGLRADLGRVAIACLAAGLLTAVVYLPYLSDLRAGEYAPAATVAYHGNPVQETARWYFASLHTPLLVIAGLGLLHRASRRRWAALAAVLLGSVLACGPALRWGTSTVVPHMPWSWLAAVVPGFATQRHDYMPRTILGIGLVCLIGLGWAWVLERLAARRPSVGRPLGWALTLVLLAAILSWFPARRPALLHLATGPRVPPVYRWLAINGHGEPLLELPDPVSVQWVWGIVYGYFSTYHWLPIVGGGYAAPPPGYLETLRGASRVLDSGGGMFVADVPVTWVLVHTALLPLRSRAAVEHPPPWLEEVLRLGPDFLYRVRRSSHGE